MQRLRKVKAIGGAAILLGACMVWTASEASAATCGFTGLTSGNPGGGDDGKYEDGTYLNCSNHNEKIRVNYFYSSEERCVSPGETHLSANPNLGALTGANKIGDC